jgi:hypothetical protein
MPMGNGSDLWGGRGRAEKESRGGRMEGFEALVDAAFAAAGVGRGWMAELENMRYGCPWVAAGGTSYEQQVGGLRPCDVTYN